MKLGEYNGSFAKLKYHRVAELKEALILIQEVCYEQINLGNRLIF